MRKMMIGLLFFMPLLIVMIVLFTIEFISTRVEIPVSRVEIYLDGDASETQIVKIGEKGTLTAKIYPTKATNKEVSFVVETPEGEPPLAIIEGTEITFLASGDTTVYVVTKDGGFKAYIQCYIVDEDVNDIFVDVPTALEVGESVMLNAYVLPVYALDKNIIFENLTPEIIAVDANGIVTAKRARIARIKVLSNQFEHINKLIEFEVKKSDPPKLFQKASYTSVLGEVSLKDLFAVSDIPTLKISGNGEVADGVLTFFDEGSVFVTAEGYAGSEFVYNASQSGVVIDQKSILTKDEKTPIVYVGGRTLYLTASYTALGASGELVWYSSDSSVAEYSDGKIVAKKDGLVTITVQSAYGEDSITLEIVQEILWAQFNFSEVADKKYGLKQEIVFGVDKFVKYLPYEKNTIQIEFSAIYPAQSTENIQSKFVWSSSDEGIATVDDFGLVTIVPFSEDVQKLVTITAKPIHAMYEGYTIYASYTFIINNGVDVVDWDGFMFCNGHLKRRVNVHADIAVYERAEDKWFGTAIENDVCGNGYTVNASLAVPKTMPTDGRKYTLFLVRNPNAVIDNLTIQGCDFDLESDDYGDLSDVARAGILVAYNDDGAGMYDAEIKNCIIENANIGISHVRGKLAVAGCVFRNIAKFGIELNTKDSSAGVYYDNDVVLRNNVFYNCLLFPVLISPEIAANGRDNRIRVEGIFKTYNWRTIDQIPFVELVSSVKIVADYFAALVPLCAAEIRTEIEKDKRYVKMKDNLPYHLLSIVEISVSLKSDDGGLPIIQPSYTVSFLDSPFVLQDLEVKVESFIIGLKFHTLPAESDYIEIDDTFGAEDREVMREP